MENEKQLVGTATEAKRGDVNPCGNAGVHRKTPYSEFYIRQWYKSDDLEQLQQLVRIVWDGDLINKSATTRLHKQGLISRAYGYNIINENGIELLHKLGVINP